MANSVADRPVVAMDAFAAPADPGRLHWVRGPRRIVREQWLTVLAAMVALVSAFPVAYGAITVMAAYAREGAYIRVVGNIGLISLAALLSYGTVSYFLARIGHLARLRHTAGEVLPDPVVCGDLEDGTSVVALVPSYLEDPTVVFRTLMSAALQAHARRRVVLLIDDPPGERSSSDSLRALRALPGTIQELFRPMREWCELALGRLESRVEKDDFNPASEARQAADLCGQAAAWFEGQAHVHDKGDAAASFFSELIFRMPASRWRREAHRWERAAETSDAPPSLDEVRRIYLWLLRIFSVEITSFERKRFVNLSHAPNKAMNINTYLALLGGSYRCERHADATMLLPCAVPAADLIVPDADFVLILDADTIVSADYTGKLLRRFRSEGGERFAVVQSPYSTFPSTRGVLQRIAGAQTDVQYLVHQGLTQYSATYWVGANALVRVAALRDLAVHDVERGFPIVKFISDRTLIEDTESTIELVGRGWRLFNHLERLAFSMTPPDFGSLLIQRQRWANGGLLIVPKLFRYLRHRKFREQLAEGFMRLHYLISLGPVSMALLIALGVSWDRQVRTVGLLGTGLIYYATYARDLHLLGYRWHDVFRVVALNIVLIPVNLIGMASSIVQAVGGRKPRFRRTPKVNDRTPVPARYVLAELLLLGVWCAQAVAGLMSGAAIVGVLMLVHALFATYAVGAYIGFGDAARDLGVPWRDWRGVGTRRLAAAVLRRPWRTDRPPGL
jgi:cellulose synthase/poly-beta-1,6-N-acetylglucosamine synthase-like glycosyltransferase